MSDNNELDHGEDSDVKSEQIDCKLEKAVKPKKPRTQKQIEAAKKNIVKAQAVRAKKREMAKHLTGGNFPPDGSDDDEGAVNILKTLADRAAEKAAQKAEYFKPVDKKMEEAPIDKKVELVEQPEKPTKLVKRRNNIKPPKPESESDFEPSDEEEEESEEEDIKPHKAVKYAKSKGGKSKKLMKPAPSQDIEYDWSGMTRI